MNRLNVTALAAALVLTLPAGPATAQEGTDAAKEAVQSMRDAYFSTYEAGNAEKAVSYFAEGGALLPPTSSTVRGTESIRQRLTDFLGSQTISLQAISEETLRSGDRVLDRGMLAIEVTPDGAQQSSTDTGKYVLVAVRESAEGQEPEWRIQWLIWNTDHPITADSGSEES